MAPEEESAKSPILNPTHKAIHRERCRVKKSNFQSVLIKTTILFLLGFVCSAAAIDPPATIAGPVTNPANGFIYCLLEKNTWTGSQTSANRLGGNLASIKDTEENRWIADTFSKHVGSERRLWIGLNDRVENGHFTWISGGPVTYFNWYGGEPNSIGTEHFVYMYKGKWDNARDIDTDFNGQLICGVMKVQILPSQPSTTKLAPSPEPTFDSTSLQTTTSRIGTRKFILLVGVLSFFIGGAAGGIGVHIFKNWQRR